MTQYMTPEEVATRLRVTPKAVRAWCRSGQLPAERAGRKWLIRPEQVTIFVTRPGKLAELEQLSPSSTAAAGGVS